MRRGSLDYGFGLEPVVLVVVDVSELEDGDEAVVVVEELEELELPPAGDGFTIVVLFSVFFSAGAPGVTVSVFCSHAAKRAAPARMQIYFFIIGRLPM